MADFADNPTPTPVDGFLDDQIEGQAESSGEPDTGSSDRLVEDVLREAQALLADPDAGEPASAASLGSDASGSAPEAIDLQDLVGRVDGLLGDLGQLATEIDAADRSAAGLDLTMVLPSETPDPEDTVPDLGSAGPQVDLFATEDRITDQASPPATSSEVVLETVATVSSGTGPSTPNTAESLESSDPSNALDRADSGELVDDLAAALAAEFDQPELVAQTPNQSSKASPKETSEATPKASPTSASTDSGRNAFSVTPISDTEVALMSAMAEEFGVEPRELPPVEDEGDPFASRPEVASEPTDAARRLEDLLARRLAEEYDLDAELLGDHAPESDSDNDSDSGNGAATTNDAEATSTVIEANATPIDHLQSDIDAVARAEMEALEALGSDLGADADRGEPIDADGSIEHDEADESGASPLEHSLTAPSMTGDDTPAEAIPAATSPPDDGVGVEASDPSPVDEAELEPVVVHSADQSRGPSTLVRLGALPFRVIPVRLHRHATPIALSLAAWVPLAWGYAIFAPTLEPAPARIDALPAGLRADLDESVVDPAEVDEDHVADPSPDAAHASH